MLRRYVKVLVSYNYGLIEESFTFLLSLKRLYRLYNHEDKSAQSRTKINQIVTFSIDAPHLTVFNSTVAYLTPDLFLLLYQNLILLHKSDFSLYYNIIRRTGHISAFCFLTDVNIDKRHKINEDERPQAIFVMPYSKTGLTTQCEIFS